MIAGPCDAGAEIVRIATFHTELSRDGPGLLLRDILSGTDPQVEAVLGVIRAADADVLVLQGIDYDLDGLSLAALAGRLDDYHHRFAVRPNRGVGTGLDLDGDGRLNGPADAYGHATFPGQGGMAVLSRLPIDTSGVRDFTDFEWHDLPGSRAPAELPQDMPLSTTGHWDVPIRTARGGHLHLLTWHASAPIFQLWNNARNHDETAFWLRYLSGDLEWTAPQDFIVMGAANLDPHDGDGDASGLNSLLNDERIFDPAPRRNGPVGSSDRHHDGDPALDTATWPEGPGDLRVDYVLPAAHLAVRDAGVFWPDFESELGREVAQASRHRLVWVDLYLPEVSGGISEAARPSRTQK